MCAEVRSIFIERTGPCRRGFALLDDQPEISCAGRSQCQPRTGQRPPPALEHRRGAVPRSIPVGTQEVTSKASTTIQAQQPDGFQVPVTLIVRV